MNKFQSLAKFLELDESKAMEIQEENDSTFTYGDQEYLVLTDSEADELAKAQILDLLWAFDVYFLSGKTGLDSEVFKAIQKNGRCEDNNTAMTALIKGTCGLDSFVKSAISTDGRGNFLGQYDNGEKKQGEYFIYRGN